MIFPNDWQIKKCLVLSLSLLLAMLGLIGLAGLGLDVPVLRQIVGFAFLTLIPGMLILRILKVHNKGIIESLLYSVGLSLAFVMAVGVAANFALPPLGVSHPIALAPLTATLVVFFLILCFFAYARDKNFRPAKPPTEDNKEAARQSFFANLNPFLLAVLLPLLAVLGASLVNSYYNNVLLFALIFIIVAIISLVAFNRFIPPRVYPFMIFMMAAALIYQTTLISSNLVGTDIHGEYYMSQLVLENGYWDATIAYLVNSCLSIVMLAPVYSLLLNMDIVWLLKIVYPLFFCLAPLAIFRILHLQIKPRYAFFATLFFIAMPMFFMDMAQLARQQVSELFFVLVILLLVDRSLTLIPRTTLALIFGFGVIVSHYGMGTGYIGYLILGSLLIVFIKSRPGRRLWQWLVGKSRSLPADLKSAGAFNKKTLAIIAGVSLVFMLGYYSVVASGAALHGIGIGGGVVEGTTEQVTTGSLGFLNPLAKEPLAQTALGLDFLLASGWGKAWRIFQYLVELCLIIGFIRLVFRPAGLGKFKTEYISLTVVSVLILLSIYVLPTYSSYAYGMGSVRIFQITLLLMAPLFLFGGEAIAYGIGKSAGLFRRIASPRLSPGSPVFLQSLVLAILIPYFIFNSGVVFELSRSQTTQFIDTPYSIALSSYRVDVSTVFTRQDVAAADWLFRVDDENYGMSADYHGNKIFLHYGLFSDSERWQQLTYYYSENISYPSYIYLRTWNTENKMLTFAPAYAARQHVSFDDIPGFVPLIDKGDIIYNNDGARVLLLRRVEE